MTRLFQRIAADELALGVWIKGGPHLVSSIAKAGFDFVRPDMMFSSIDWKELDHILRVCESTGVTCWTRMPASPWYGGAENMQVTVDAARAFSLGVHVVHVSVSSAAQVRALVKVAKDWHRSGAGEYPSSADEFHAQGKRMADSNLLMPAIEAGQAFEELDEILDIEGLRAIMLAVTDLSEALGHSFDYEHPEVWKVVDHVVKRAREKNIVVAANTGYKFTTPEEIVGRVNRLHSHGVKLVLMQGLEFLFETYGRRLIGDIRKEIR